MRKILLPTPADPGSPETSRLGLRAFHFALLRMCKNSKHLRNTQLAQVSFRRDHQLHSVILGGPYFRICCAKEDEAARSGRRSQMGNATVVPDELCVGQQHGQAPQRPVYGIPNPIRESLANSRNLSFVRFASDNNDVPARRIDEQLINQLDPVFDWPILSRAAAARMQGDEALTALRPDRLLFGCIEINLGVELGDRDPESG